jgi:hypothetical protein
MKADDYVSEFIKIGKCELHINTIINLSEEIQQSGINRRSPEFWRRTCERLSKADAIGLFKGLVISEREFELSGGSVSANIWVFRNLQNHCTSEESASLTDWALQNRGKNHYTPLGTPIYEDNLEDYNERLRIKAPKKTLADEEEKRSREGANVRKIERLQAAEDHLKAANERRDARLELLTRLRAMSSAEKLQWLVSSEVSLNALPPEIFDIESISTNYSGSPEIGALEKRLGSYKGHWKKLLQALENSAVKQAISPATSQV